MSDFTILETITILWAAQAVAGAAGFTIAWPIVMMVERAREPRS